MYTPFVGNPRVYPLCDPGPALSENLTSACLSYSGISHLTRIEVSLKGRQPPLHSYVSPFDLFSCLRLPRARLLVLRPPRDGFSFLPFSSCCLS